jgi:Ni,Fe-hydrogenase maturation factor
VHQFPKILIYGYGNPGRQDDVLGIKLADIICDWAARNHYNFIETDCNYQLNIEDASIIQDKNLVIFADASQEMTDDFLFTKVNPDSKVDFTMHHVRPEYIQYLCNEIYQKTPESFLLHIKGYQWEFMGELTGKAQTNLNEAAEFLKLFLKQRISKYINHINVHTKINDKN